jgi:membrane associated rhomboid family serine protease
LKIPPAAFNLVAMIEDRDYMRQPAYHEPRISFTVGLLIVNAVAFVIHLVVEQSLRGFEIEQKYFALSLEGLKSGYVWQLLTFQFMHANVMHLIFNSLAIFFFGRSVETVLGRNRFLTVYFSSGIIGGSVQMLFALCLPNYFGGNVVGASAGAYGLVAAFAVLNWEEQFTLLIYFFPVTMRGKTLLWVSIGLALVGLLTPGSGVANAAHLGGILTGFFCVRYIFQGRWPQLDLPSRQREPHEVVAAGKNKFWSSAAKTGEDLSAEEFLQREVDPILDKISAHGIQSLTMREREILEKARAKMAKR